MLTRSLKISWIYSWRSLRVQDLEMQNQTVKLSMYCSISCLRLRNQMNNFKIEVLLRLSNGLTISLYSSRSILSVGNRRRNFIKNKCLKIIRNNNNLLSKISQKSKKLMIKRLLSQTKIKSQQQHYLLMHLLNSFKKCSAICSPKSSRQFSGTQMLKRSMRNKYKRLILNCLRL